MPFAFVFYIWHPNFAKSYKFEKNYWFWVSYTMCKNYIWSQCPGESGCVCVQQGPNQGWGQIRFFKYKYKYIFFRSFKYKYKYKYTGKNLIKYKYKYKYSSSNTNTITQWGRDKIAAILQMTYWNLLYCKKTVYTFKFHWKLFPKVQSTISLHWFIQWLGAE